jgi:hypothetical protein
VDVEHLVGAREAALRFARVRIQMLHDIRLRDAASSAVV